jgi:GMP synthase-like glutamine amidotransferase
MKPICIVQNWAPESPGFIVDYLKEHAVPYNVVRNYDGETLPDPANIEAAIVLGTPVSVRDYREHENLKKLFGFMSELVRRDMPTLGICFGGQMLARVLGAEVTRNEVREIGIYTASLSDEGAADPLFEGIDREFEVFHWHNDTFAVPFGGSLLATGATCRNQAFRKNRAVGIQFHIEPRPEEIPTWCDDYTSELIEEGLTKEKIVADYNARAETLKRTAYRLVQNFLEQ